jgi:hypothetical protein
MTGCGVFKLLSRENSFWLVDCELLLPSGDFASQDTGVAGSYSLGVLLLVRRLSMFVGGRGAEFSCELSVSLMCFESIPYVFCATSNEGREDELGLFPVWNMESKVDWVLCPSPVPTETVHP